jgi:putative FmdB family regulatory protein
MPAYEYYCRPCDRTFTVMMSMREHETTQVKCPHCHGVQVEQLLSTFSVKTSKKS